MAHHRNTKPLWLIEPLPADEFRDTLIGSIVKYPDIPTEKHIPYKTTPPRDIVPDLDPKPVQVRNIRFLQRRVKDASVRASLNDIVEAFAERATEDRSERTATVARVWHMDSPGEKFKELLKDKGYFDQLFDLLQNAHDNQGYFITDIVTLVNLEVSDGVERKTGAGLDVTMPFEATAPGVSIGVSAGAGAKMQVIREKESSATYNEEMIVFLGYRRVTLEKVAGTRARLERMFMGGEKRGFTVRDGFDYWPELTLRPYQGNTESVHLGPWTPGPLTPGAEEQRQLGSSGPGAGAGGSAAAAAEEEEQKDEDDEEMEEIVKELGFDVEAVGGYEDPEEVKETDSKKKE